MAESRPGDIFQPGELLNNTYRIENILGRGGTSEVYKARNDISGRHTAIKVLKSEFSGDEAFLTLMRREEEIREIRHDAVVRYSENHRTPDGLIYLVMDYVEGPGLDAILKGGGLPAPDLVQVCRRVADGLKMAHSRRIIHRDLSPDNIILRGGVPTEAVIIDFGIAKDANPGAQTIVGNEFAGKYAYAAPEQLSGNTDTRSDLYSLGALLLATYRGQRPDIGANPMEVLKKKALPLDTSGVPEPLKSLIDKMTQPDAAKRFQSADEIIRAIDSGMFTGAMDERTVVVPRATATSSASATKPATVAAKPVIPAAAVAKSGGRGALWLVLVVLLLAAVGAGGWFGGFFDNILAPKLAAADPYSLIVERPTQGAARAVGYVPSDAVASDLTKAMAGIGGTADLTLASGAIGETWGPDVVSVVKTLDKVDTWRIAVNGNDAAVTGTTTDPAVQAAVMAAIGIALPGTLKGRADIALKPQFLTADDLTPV
ncbi:MAG: serine/threonine-protein kinase, partial [Paracoccaceae bacterium]